MSRFKGKISEWLGLATGDREVEAKGKIEQREGQSPSRAQVRRETRRVKAEHHDYGDRIPPQRVHHADRTAD